MKSFFPDNAVEYFVSYYDYYQPEAYVPRTDTYIEKDSQINEQIDRMRHAATQALLERNDVVVVASVSCIYGIGSVESYAKMVAKLERWRHGSTGTSWPRRWWTCNTAVTTTAFQRGVVPVARRDRRHLSQPLRRPRLARSSLFGDEIESVHEFDPLTGDKTADLKEVTVYANSHYVTPRPTLAQAVRDIQGWS